MAKTLGSLRTVSGDCEVFLVKIEDADLAFRFNRKENLIEVRRNGEILVRELSLSTPVHREFEIAGTSRVLDISARSPDSSFSKNHSIAIRIDNIPVSGTDAEPINRVLRAKGGIIAVISILVFRAVATCSLNLIRGDVAAGIASLVLYLLFALGGVGLLLYFRRNMGRALWISFFLAILVLLDHAVGVIGLLNKASQFDANAAGQIFGFLVVGSVELGIAIFLYRAIRDLKQFHRQAESGGSEANAVSVREGE